MHELVNNGWIKDIGDTNTYKKTLNLDNEVNDINDLNSEAIISLGDIKLIF